MLRNDIEIWCLNNGFLKPNQRRKNNFIKYVKCVDIEYKANQDICDKLNQVFASIKHDIYNYFHSTNELLHFAVCGAIRRKMRLRLSIILHLNAAAKMMLLVC